jgi:taurine dioxygenase
MNLSLQNQHVRSPNRLGREVLPGCNLNNISDRQRTEFKKLLWEHGVVVVRKQKLTALQLEDFAAKTFGNFLSKARSFDLNPEIDPNLQSPRTAILGNYKGLGEEISGKFAWQWHHDKDRLPGTEGLEMNEPYIVMLYGVKVPPEGLDGKPHTTNFLDTIAAYNNLPLKLQKELEHISLYHSPPVRSGIHPMSDDVPRKVHPIISKHKITHKKGLYLGSNTAIRVGMEDELEKAKSFWQQLFNTVLETTSIYSHSWQPGDIVFWDNSQVMHSGTPYDATKHQRIALRLGIINSL